MKHVVTADDKYIQMTESPAARLVMRLAVPSILSMLVSSVYNMADTYFVGRLGTQQTAGVGVVFSLMSIIQAIGFLFGQGTGNYISRALGARDVKAAESIATTGFVSSFAAGCLIAVPGLVFIHPMVRVMGATETIAPYAADYAYYILWGAPFMMASFTLNNQLRYQGNAVYGMIALTSGGLLNIALDPLFIFTFGMGVAGAALATAISQVVGFVLLLWGTTRGGSLRIKPLAFRPTLRQYGEVIRGGLPSLWRQGLQALSVVAMNQTIVMNRVLIPHTDEAIAAMTVVLRVMGLLFSSMLGFGQGFQPVCGFNYGAKLYPRVRKAFNFSVIVSSAVLLVLCAGSFVFANNIITLFRDDAEVIRIGARALRYHLIPFPLVGFATIATMMTQTIGKPVRASLLAASRNGMFFLPLLLLLPPIMGLDGVLLSQPISDAITFVLSLVIVRSIFKEMNPA